METEYVKFILSILSGLAAAIPLVVKLCEYVQKSVREKNWQQVVGMVMDLMASAEDMFDTGAERKEWVMAMLKVSSVRIDYDIDYDAISDMIDSLCELSKVVNSPEKAGD